MWMGQSGFKVPCERGDVVMRQGIEHAPLTVLHEYLLAVLHTYILLLVEGVEHAHYLRMYITHCCMTCMPQQTPTPLSPVNVTLNSLSYNPTAPRFQNWLHLQACLDLSCMTQTTPPPFLHVCCMQRNPTLSSHTAHSKRNITHTSCKSNIKYILRLL